MKVNAVSMNETSYYSIREEDKPFIKEIHSVYIYNPESATYLCELTPSFELLYLYTYIVGTDKMIDDMRDLLTERYCYEPTDDTYMHCSSIRAMKPKECGEFETMEEAREHLQGNWPI